MLISSETKFRGRVVTANVEVVDLPNGHRATLDIVHHPGGAAIVAVDARLQVCVLRQYRHAAGGWVWELPAGKLETGELPLVTAQREIVEEAGVRATQWDPLGAILSSPGVFTERIHLFLATALEPAAQATEPGELLEVHWIAFDEACRRVLADEISDAKTCVGLLRAAGHPTLAALRTARDVNCAAVAMPPDR